MMKLLCCVFKKGCLVVCSVTLLAMTACTGKTSALEERIDSLNQVCQKQDADLKDMSDFMGTISSSLDSIAEHEAGLLSTNQGRDGGIITKQEIRRRLEEFGALVGKQKHELDSLKKQLELSNNKHAEQMRKLLANYEQQLKEKDEMIASLKEEIEQKNIDITRLKTDVNSLNLAKQELETITVEQEQTLKAQDEQMNRAYVCIGTSKDLKARGVLTGGFLAKKKVDPSKMNASYFSAVDIREYNNVTLQSKKPQLLPQRPASSFTIVPQGNGLSILTITNPATFWSISNYLVIRL